jgi:hypothetical protein
MLRVIDDKVRLVMALVLGRAWSVRCNPLDVVLVVGGVGMLAFPKYQVKALPGHSCRCQQRRHPLQENKVYSSVFIYSKVPRNITILYSSVPKPMNISTIDEHRPQYILIFIEYIHRLHDEYILIFLGIEEYKLLYSSSVLDSSGFSSVS